MPLAEDVRDLADRVLVRLAEARDFYLHTRQAWRVVQQFAHEGHGVGIFTLLRNVIEAMADAAIRRASKLPST